MDRDFSEQIDGVLTLVRATTGPNGVPLERALEEVKKVTALMQKAKDVDYAEWLHQEKSLLDSKLSRLDDLMDTNSAIREPISNIHKDLQKVMGVTDFEWSLQALRTHIASLEDALKNELVKSSDITQLSDKLGNQHKELNDAILGIKDGIATFEKKVEKALSANENQHGQLLSKNSENVAKSIHDMSEAHTTSLNKLSKDVQAVVGTITTNLGTDAKTISDEQVRISTNMKNLRDDCAAIQRDIATGVHDQEGIKESISSIKESQKTMTTKLVDGIQSYSNDLRTLRMQVDASERRLLEVEATNESLGKEVQELKTRLKEEMESSEFDSIQFGVDRGMWETKRSKLQEEIEDARTEWGTERSQLQRQIEDAHKELETERSQLQGEIQEIQTKYNALEQDIESSEFDSLQVNVDRGMWETERSQLQRQIEDAHTEWETERSQLQRQIQDAHTEWETERSQLQGEFEDIRREWHNDAATLQMDVDDLRLKAESLQKKNEANEKLLEACDANVLMAQAARTRLQEDLNARVSLCQTHEDQIEALQAEVFQIRVQQGQQALKEDLMDSINQVYGRGVDSGVEAVDAEILNLRLQNLEQENRVMAEEERRSKQETNRLLEELEEANKDLAQQKAEFEGVLKDKEDYIRRIEEYREAETQGNNTTHLMLESAQERHLQPENAEILKVGPLNKGEAGTSSRESELEARERALAKGEQAYTPRKRQCEDPSEPSTDGANALSSYLERLAVMARHFPVVDNDWLGIETVSKLVGIIGNKEDHVKLRKFLKRGTREKWFCLHEVLENGHHVHKEITSDGRGCKEHPGTCRVVMTTKINGDRHLRFCQDDKISTA